ncbi:prephenate dehydratase [Mariniblastus fucicola]|uniref:Bifunctional chorismate mutase/prephenate dehydratase n=1 Tax=Mariniblastus fucicola TaxID=980251 RepID=A0A5B9P164_9BACT|nr:prephenate dehydratase [Mariniblastus fucicola]QEG20237.1 P-protein [Mariniblastus fucicola]
MTDETNEDPLAELRKNIDDVDRQLVDLINQRARHVIEVGKIKQGSSIPIYAPHREAAVMKKVAQLNKGGVFPQEAIEAIYREMMSGSFKLEQPLRIGYLGPIGTFSHLAATKKFGACCEYEDLRAIEGVFEEVARGHVNYGLVPIENSIGGGINETLDSFMTYHDRLNIYGEVRLGIHFCLLSTGKPEDVKKIYSRPEAFAQCRNWLATQYPNAERIPAESTAAAARQAVDEYLIDPESGAAAIGSSLAGEIYGLHPLFQAIEDRQSNVTRFLILSREETEISKKDKTSIMFTTDHHPGSLVDVLSVFKRNQINLSHIEKRPSREENWDYTFFIEIEGHRKDVAIATVVGEARAHCSNLTVLGSFPAGETVL